jgi:hypothetical protein
MKIDERKKMINDKRIAILEIRKTHKNMKMDKEKKKEVIEKVDSFVDKNGLGIKKLDFKDPIFYPVYKK